MGFVTFYGKFFSAHTDTTKPIISTYFYPTGLKSVFCVIVHQAKFHRLEGMEMCPESDELTFIRINSAHCAIDAKTVANDYSIPTQTSTRFTLFCIC